MPCPYRSIVGKRHCRLLRPLRLHHSDANGSDINSGNTRIDITQNHQPVFRIPAAIPLIVNKAPRNNSPLL